tara:strand:+ start:358 stop:576 length:219 start_codon:yes stop_codon:yes gene_type:complete
MIMGSNGLIFGIELNIIRRLKMPEVKTKPKTTPQWKLNHEDYLALLKSIDINAKAVNSLVADVKRIKIRMGL